MVSVVVPAYNGEAFLEQTLDSVLAQTVGPLELIVCDDGSTDGTGEILNRYAPRLISVRQPNAGVSAARNAGARQAQGEFLAFLDQDDVWEPNLLDVQIEALKAHPDWALTYADSWVIDREGSVRGRRGNFLEYRDGEVFEHLMYGNFIPLETTVMRGSLFRDLGGFNTELHYMEDYEFFLRATRGHRIGRHVDPLARYRIHEHNLSHDIEAILREWLLILEDLPRTFTDLSPSERSIAAEQHGLRAGELAWRALRRLDLETADARLEQAKGRTGLMRVRLARAALGVLPRGVAGALMGMLPRRKLYGVPRPDGSN